LEFEDRIRFSTPTRAAKVIQSGVRAVAGRTPADRLDASVEAYRLAQEWPVGRRFVRRAHALLAAGARPDYALARRRGLTVGAEATPLDRTLVLKAPSPDGEKGVLLVFGEYNWLRLLAHPDQTRAVHARYEFVLIAGWSPAEYSPLVALAERLGGPLFVEAGNFQERPVLAALHERIHPTPTICSDWLDPARFTPRPFDQKDLDLVMVANWAPYKRHWRLFQVLAGMAPGLRVTLIGQRAGAYTVERVRRQAADFGAPQAIEFLDNPPTPVVHDRLARAKGSLILSRREGPCVAVAEAFLSGTPVALLRGAHVGTTAHINEHTGRLLPERTLARDLTQFLADAAGFAPRAWAEANISFRQSIAKLNADLRGTTLRAGRRWTRDLTAYHWAPYPAYLSAADSASFASERRQLQQDCPALFGPATFG
jgi:glycosyltransferase involved in cell wall biosynthesis